MRQDRKRCTSSCDTRCTSGCQSGSGGSVRRIAAASFVMVALIFISACMAPSADEGSALAIGGRLQITKVVNEAWLPFDSSAANDLVPFLVMAGLLIAAAVLMWRRPKTQSTRRWVQSLSAIAFIIGIHPCGCMTRDLIAGISDLSINDLSAFKYMIVFTTVAAFTAVLGRGFCGWLCPVGFAQELVSKTSGSFDAAIRKGFIGIAIRKAAVFFMGGAVAYYGFFLGGVFRWSRDFELMSIYAISMIAMLLVDRLVKRHLSKAQIAAMLVQAVVYGGAAAFVIWQAVSGDPAFALPYAVVFVACSGIIILGGLIKSPLVTKYLFGVSILVAIIYGFYLTKPGQQSVIEYAMVFFVLGLTLIVLTVLGDEGKDRFFKKFRYVLWFTIVGIYVYQAYNVGPMCLFFQGSAEWPVLLSFGGVFLLSLLVSMSWCRYMCPEGAALGILANHSAWQINRNDRCTGCGVCTKVCPVRCIDYGIRDKKVCLYCMRCVAHCPADALELKNELGRTEQAIPYPPPPEYIPEGAK